MAHRKLNFGILGTGNIARQFARGVLASRRCNLAAVGSRTEAAATAFAAEAKVPAAHPTYEALLADPTVDAVYVSLPNHLHHDWTIAALKAGKHVLCEKPIAVNHSEAERMFDAASRHGRRLVEAFMYRSHPQTLAVVDEVRRGTIGTVKLIRSSFCFRVRNTAGNIRFDTATAGGALMDVGCYCINFSRLIAAAARPGHDGMLEPHFVQGVAALHESGVDELSSVVMQFPGGVLAEFTCGMALQADNSAYVCGDEGYLTIPWPWKPTPDKSGYVIAHGVPPKQDITAAGPKLPVPPPRQEVTVPVAGDLYGLEADHFADHVLDDAEPALTAADSLGNMVVLDALRRQIGLTF